MNDLKEVEASAFAEFLKPLGLKSVQEYESSSEAGKAVNEAKNSLLLRLEKAQTELAFLSEADHSKSISTLEAALKQEEDKLASLLTGSGHESVVQKLQSELQ